MNDCATTTALLDVYADDETSAETNALVHTHLRECPRCLRELHDIRAMKTQLRDVLGHERAPAALRSRIQASIDAQRGHRLVGALRGWLAPVSAAAVALATWTLLPSPSPSLADAAVSEHIACALDRQVVQVNPATALERGHTVAMPWIRDAAHDIHVVDAHACGQQPMFSHVIVSVSGSLASVLIVPRPDGARAAPSQLRRGDFDVSIVSAIAHDGYLIGPRAPSDMLRDWRSPVLDRVARFLEQLEGTL